MLNTLSQGYNIKQPQLRYYIPNNDDIRRRTIAILAKCEKVERNFEFSLRKIANFFSYPFINKQTKNLSSLFNEVDIKSENFIFSIMQAGLTFATNKKIEINEENLDRVVKSGKPTIFIMNHDNQSQDPRMLAFLNTVLYEKYAREGIKKLTDDNSDKELDNQTMAQPSKNTLFAEYMQKVPRPKIVLNEDILLSMPSETKQLYETLGAVGVNANLYATTGMKNARKLIELVNGIASGNSNVFIFPEGKNAIYKYKPIKAKFQSGIASIAYRVLKKVSEVQVVPIGFAYGRKRDNLNSIFVGEPIIFKKDGSKILFSPANLNSKYTSSSYQELAKNAQDESLAITQNGIPAEGSEVIKYMADVMSENLQITKLEAINTLKKITLNLMA